MATVLEYLMVDGIFYIFKFKYEEEIYHVNLHIRNINLIVPRENFVIIRPLTGNYNTPVYFYIDNYVNDCSVIISDEYIIRNRPAESKNNFNRNNEIFQRAYSNLYPINNVFKEATTLELKSFRIGNNNKYNRMINGYN